MTLHNSARAKTPWHQILAAVLQEWLTPVGIEVIAEVPLTVKPQQADILLLRHGEQPLTAAQYCRLADGLRQSTASHLLLEFKYTESLTADAIKQAIGYEVAYRTRQRLKPSQVDMFLLCSQTPAPHTLDHWGYQTTQQTGVWANRYPILTDVTLLLLNDLSDAPHNLPLKCFASKQREKRKAYHAIHHNHLPDMSEELEYTLMGLWALLSNEGHLFMSHKPVLTPDAVKQLGKQYIQHLVSRLPAEERLAGLPAEERLKGISAEERLKGLTEEEFLEKLSVEKIKAWLAKMERLQNSQK